MAESLLENYNPLYDVHLRQYFALPHMQKHLRRMGLIDANGRMVEGQEAVYARHQVMMDMMLKNREQQLVKLADLQKKLDAAEKVEIYRRIRSGQSPESFRRTKASRSLSRGRPRDGGGSRQRRFSNSWGDKEFITKIESKNEVDPVNERDPYARLSAKASKYRYLHKLDDGTLVAYQEQLRRELDRLERFRAVSFGVHSVARQPPTANQSWFFRRRSVNSLRGRKGKSSPRRTGGTRDDALTSCPPTVRQRRNSGGNPRLPPIQRKIVAKTTTAQSASVNKPLKLPPAQIKTSAKQRASTNIKREKPEEKLPQLEAVGVSIGLLPFGGGAAAATAAAATAVAAVAATRAPSPPPPEPSPEAAPSSPEALRDEEQVIEQQCVFIDNGLQAESTPPRHIDERGSEGSPRESPQDASRELSPIHLEKSESPTASEHGNRFARSATPQDHSEHVVSPSPGSDAEILERHSENNAEPHIEISEPAETSNIMHEEERFSPVALEKVSPSPDKEQSTITSLSQEHIASPTEEHRVSSPEERQEIASPQSVQERVDIESPVAVVVADATETDHFEHVASPTVETFNRPPSQGAQMEASHSEASSSPKYAESPRSESAAHEHVESDAVSPTEETHADYRDIEEEFVERHVTSAHSMQDNPPRETPDVVGHNEVGHDGIHEAPQSEEISEEHPDIEEEIIRSHVSEQHAVLATSPRDSLLAEDMHTVAHPVEVTTAAPYLETTVDHVNDEELVQERVSSAHSINDESSRKSPAVSENAIHENEFSHSPQVELSPRDSPLRASSPVEHEYEHEQEQHVPGALDNFGYEDQPTLAETYEENASAVHHVENFEDDPIVSSVHESLDQHEMHRREDSAAVESPLRASPTENVVNRADEASEQAFVHSPQIEKEHDSIHGSETLDSSIHNIVTIESANEALHSDEADKHEISEDNNEDNSKPSPVSEVLETGTPFEEQHNMAASPALESLRELEPSTETPPQAEIHSSEEVHQESEFHHDSPELVHSPLHNDEALHAFPSAEEMNHEQLENDLLEHSSVSQVDNSSAAEHVSEHGSNNESPMSQDQDVEDHDHSRTDERVLTVPEIMETAASEHNYNSDDNLSTDSLIIHDEHEDTDEQPLGDQSYGEHRNGDENGNMNANAMTQSFHQDIHEDVGNGGFTIATGEHHEQPTLYEEDYVDEQGGHVHKKTVHHEYSEGDVSYYAHHESEVTTRLLHAGSKTPGSERDHGDGSSGGASPTVEQSSL